MESPSPSWVAQYPTPRAPASGAIFSRAARRAAKPSRAMVAQPSGVYLVKISSIVMGAGCAAGAARLLRADCGEPRCEEVGGGCRARRLSADLLGTSCRLF